MLSDIPTKHKSGFLYYISSCTPKASQNGYIEVFAQHWPCPLVWYILGHVQPELIMLFKCYLIGAPASGLPCLKVEALWAPTWSCKVYTMS